MGCSSPSQNDIPVKKTGNKFYIDVAQLQIQTIKDVDDNISENIKLKVSISPIEEGSKYNVKIFKIDDNEITTPLNELTDCTIEGNTATLNTPIIIKYIFEVDQPLSLDILVIKSDISFNYQVKTTLGRIMGSRKNTSKTPLSDTTKEILILKGDKLKHNEKIINCKFDIKTKEEDISFKDKNNKMFYEIYSDIILYRSEMLKDNGIFEPVKIPFDLFKDKNMIIKFYDSNKKEVGNFKLDVIDFVGRYIFDVKVNKIDFKIISRSVITKNFTFIDFLKSGVEIGLSVAIDFTNSNGNPSDPSSLHYIYGREPNQYERAICSCGNILSYYDYNQFYPCLLLCRVCSSMLSIIKMLMSHVSLTDRRSVPHCGR
jgi:hypothetical protein